MNKDELKEKLDAHSLWFKTRYTDDVQGERADLRGADLSHADFECALLSCALLHCADLRDADLGCADLRDALLHGADLRGADLRGADLRGADLRGADLRGASLQDADLRDAELGGANLCGANLDYSTWPLSCASLSVKIDKKIAAQLLYHALFAMQSCADDPDVAAVLANDANLQLSNQFHRVYECGKINQKEELGGYCAKLPKKADTRFDICQDIELVLKIGRDFQNKDGFRGAHFDTVKLLCDTIEYQKEQLETKTEVGDAAKLREALKSFVEYSDLVRRMGMFNRDSLIAITTKACAALAAPPRNCDVGTVTDQRKRYAKMCQYNCDGCALQDDRALKGGCEFSWAQMPYEGGGDK